MVPFDEDTSDDEEGNMDLHRAAKAGNEPAVRAMLAAGADVEAVNAEGWLPIHYAAAYGHVGIVHLLLKAAPATVSAAEHTFFTPLHLAALDNHAAVVRLLVEAALATVTAVDDEGSTALHCAARYGHAEAVQVLAEAAPALTAAVDDDGNIPLDLAHDKHAAALEASRCLVRAAPTVQPTLGSLIRKGLGAATLYANLVARLTLTQQQWQSIPAPCPDLLRVLPAVMERSVAEAGGLVGRLEQEKRARLRTAALCLDRVAAVEGVPSLPASW